MHMHRTSGAQSLSPLHLSRQLSNVCGLGRRSQLRCVHRPNRRHRHKTHEVYNAATLSTRDTSTADALQPVNRQSFDWNAQWYAIGFERDFDASKPNSFTLLGRKLCIWRDQQGQWQAFDDCCPHRLVPLSEGRISTTGNLQCAYHGWEFSSTGTCEAIPQGGSNRNPRTCATVFQAAVKQGLLWVKLVPPPQGAKAADNSVVFKEPDTSDIPILPEIDEGWVDSSSFRDLPYDYATLLENLLDVGHVPFTHHASVSKRSTASVIDLKVTERLDDGFKGVWEQGPRQGQLGTQHTHLQAPCLMRHTINGLEKKGFANVTAVYAVPTTPGRCRAIVRNVFKFKSAIPGLAFRFAPPWMTHIGNNTVLEDDVVFLHDQEPLAVQHGMGRKPVAQVYHMPGASDNYVTAFRNFLDKQAGGGPWGPMDKVWLQAAGPRLPREQLLDRFHSHTAHCKLCSTVLHRVQRTRTALKYGAGMLTAWAAVTAAVALGASSSIHEATSVAMQSGTGQHSGWFASLGMALLRAAESILPTGDPASLMASAATCVGIVLVMGAARAYLHKLENSFINGVYPPPRNIKNVQDEAFTASS